MAVIGIEFTSRFTEFLFFAVFLAIVFGVVLLFLRLRQSQKILAVLRRDNSKLRNEIANIIGWTGDGRLPDDWQEKLHNTHTSKASSILSKSEKDNNPLLLAAHHALQSIEPPYFASNDTNEALENEHNRTIELMERLALDIIDPEPALANGDFDKLISIWLRLETYFPDETETFAYGIAANAVFGSLKKKAIQVLAPRPLTVANPKNCVLTTDDGEGLRDIKRIRAAALSAGARITTLQPTEEIIVDCQCPGWSGPNGRVNPRTLILDKSW